MPLTTLVIGRSPFADIVLLDASVAARHAELVVATDGRLYLTDCASPGGTWRRRGGRRSEEGTGGEEDWTPIRQDFIAEDEPLRFGAYVATAAGLLKRIGVLVQGDGAGGGEPHARARRAPSIGQGARCDREGT